MLSYDHPAISRMITRNTNMNNNMNNNFIRRNISSSKRMMEIIGSMRNPIVHYRYFDGLVPTLIIKAMNEDGICMYRCVHGGLIGLNDLMSALENYPNNLKIMDL